MTVSRQSQRCKSEWVSHPWAVICLMYQCDTSNAFKYWICWYVWMQMNSCLSVLHLLATAWGYLLGSVHHTKITWVVLAVSPGTDIHPHVSNCSLPFLHLTASLATGSNKISSIPGAGQFSKEDFTTADVCIQLTVLCQDKQDLTFTPALVVVWDRFVIFLHYQSI